MSVTTEEAPLAHEVWRTGEVDHGPVEERGAAEGRLLEELHRRGPLEASGNTTVKKHVST
jgi:hypothetical protein